MPEFESPRFASLHKLRSRYEVVAGTRTETSGKKDGNLKARPRRHPQPFTPGVRFPASTRFVRLPRGGFDSSRAKLRETRPTAPYASHTYTPTSWHVSFRKPAHSSRLRNPSSCEAFAAPSAHQNASFASSASSSSHSPLPTRHYSVNRDKVPSPILVTHRKQTVAAISIETTFRGFRSRARCTLSPMLHPGMRKEGGR